MLLRTEPVDKISTAILASPEMDFWQDSDGRVLIATGTHDTMEEDLEGSARSALQRLAKLAPVTQEVRYQTLMLRNRPIPGDGLPMVGPVPRVENLWMALTHSGMTLAPVIANGISDMVLGEFSRTNLAPFLPERMLEE